MDDLIEKVAQAPAVALDSTIIGTQRITKNLASNKPLRRARSYWRMLGPGLTTGAADDDPSGIATYSQAGASHGFSFLWLAPFTFPFMSAVQEMCARIGIVTGEGLAANIRRLYPPWVLYISTVLLFIANSINIGADLGAMAKATQLLIPDFPFGPLVVLFTLASLLLQIFLSYSVYAKYLKWLALVLFSYIFTAFTISFDWSAVLVGAIIPRFEATKEQLLLLCAILGTTISPYLFFWQTSQEVEEDILAGKTSIASRREETSMRDIKSMRVDVWSGMFLSNLVMFFIIAVCGAVLHAAGITNIETAEQAANALRPLAGENAYLLFTLGIIGTGMLAVPVLAGSASYAISESFQWKAGLYRKLKSAHAFYGVIMFAMFLGLGMNFIGLDPIKALLYSAVINGLIAPLVLFLIVQISSNEKVMGKWVNTPFAKQCGLFITGVMVFVGIATIVSFFV